MAALTEAELRTAMSSLQTCGKSTAESRRKATCRQVLRYRHSAKHHADYTKNLSLGMFRSDYMIHQDTSDPSSVPKVKQVEFNTIASSFGGLSSQTCRLHK